MSFDFSVSDTSIGAVHNGVGGRVDSHRRWNVPPSSSPLKSDYPADDGRVRGPALHDSAAFVTAFSSPQSLSRRPSESSLEEASAVATHNTHNYPQPTMESALTPTTIKSFPSTKAQNSHSSSTSPPPISSTRTHKRGPPPSAHTELPRLLTAPPMSTRSTSATTTVLLSEDAANLWLAMDSLLRRSPEPMLPSELVELPEAPGEKHNSQWTAPISSSALPLGPMERWERPELIIREVKDKGSGKKWRGSVGKRFSLRRDTGERFCIIA